MFSKLPNEIRLMIMKYACPTPEISVPTWQQGDSRHSNVHQAPGLWSAEDRVTFNVLSRHDVLFENSAWEVWHWLVSNATWRIQLPADVDDPDSMHVKRCVDNIKRLEHAYRAKVQHV